VFHRDERRIEEAGTPEESPVTGGITGIAPPVMETDNRWITGGPPPVKSAAMRSGGF
jgi:hypothetical protein